MDALEQEQGECVVVLRDDVKSQVKYLRSLVSDFLTREYDMATVDCILDGNSCQQEKQKSTSQPIYDRGQAGNWEVC